MDMRLIKAGAWMALALGAAAVFGTFGAGSASASAERAFRGHTAGTIEFTSANTATVTGDGQATSLGNYDRLEHVTIGVGGAVSGDITLTDDSTGDRIFISFAGQFVSGNDIEGTYTVTDGTGRFDGATGTATFRANTPDFVNMTATWEGTIDY
jgi:hypothetical protein